MALAKATKPLIVKCQHKENNFTLEYYMHPSYTLIQTIQWIDKALFDHMRDEYLKNYSIISITNKNGTKILDIGDIKID